MVVDIPVHDGCAAWHVDFASLGPFLGGSGDSDGRVPMLRRVHHGHEVLVLVQALVAVDAPLVLQPVSVEPALLRP